MSQGPPDTSQVCPRRNTLGWGPEGDTQGGASRVSTSFSFQLRSPELDFQVEKVRAVNSNPASGMAMTEDLRKGGYSVPQAQH